MRPVNFNYKMTFKENIFKIIIGTLLLCPITIFYEGDKFLGVEGVVENSEILNLIFGKKCQGGCFNHYNRQNTTNQFGRAVKNHDVIAWGASYQLKLRGVFHL